MDYILGVDGGGTKTSVQICNLDGKLFSKDEAGSGNYKGVGIKKAELNITDAILRAMKKIKNEKEIFFKSSCFGLSGLDSSADLDIYRKIIFNEKIKNYLNPQKTIICNDSRIGLVAGTDSKNGIIIICGTGSNCFGINEEGEEAKANGWDYILGDEGSGYEIGIKALRAAMRAYDGRGKNTLLLETILEDLKLKDVEELIKWVYGNPFTTDRFAVISKTVCRTAEMGDKISADILEKEAEEAFISISAVARKLDLTNRDFDLVFVGNVFKCERYFKAVLIKKLKDKFPKINFIPLTKKPVEGAVKMALRNI